VAVEGGDAETRSGGIANDSASAASGLKRGRATGGQEETWQGQQAVKQGVEEGGRGREGREDMGRGRDGGQHHRVEEVDVDFAHFLNERFGDREGDLMGGCGMVGGDEGSPTQGATAKTKKKKMDQQTHEPTTATQSKKRSGPFGQESHATGRQSSNRRARVASDVTLEQFGEREHGMY